MQLLVAFPIAYTLYALTASNTLTIIQFLAPFVILGIGLDDVFVFVGIYRSLLVYADSFDVATRLQVAWRRASGSMLATSATSAVAFLANAISPVPAVRLFGLLLGILVAVNYVLAVTWLPVATVAWERYALDPWRASWGTHTGATLGQQNAVRGGGLQPFDDPDDPDAALANAAHSNPIGTVQHTPRTKGARAFGDDRARSTGLRGTTERIAAVSTTAAVAAAAAARKTGGHCFGRVPPGRVLWQRAFVLIWRARHPLILVLVGISAWGVWLSTRLQPADSLPKLFDDGHNVQKFIDHWTTNFTDGSVFGCPVCLLADSQIALEQDDFGSNTDLFSPSGSSTGRSAPGANTPATDTVPTTPLTGPVVNPLPPAAPPATTTSPTTTTTTTNPTTTTTTNPATTTTSTATGTTGGTTSAATPPASPPAEPPASPPPPPPPPSPPPSTTPVDTDSPLAAVNIDEQRLREERINTNTIAVSMVWGVKEPTRSEGSDAFGLARAGSVVWDQEFELGDERIQRAVLDQVRCILCVYRKAYIRVSKQHVALCRAQGARSTRTYRLLQVTLNIAACACMQYQVLVLCLFSYDETV